MIVDAYVIVYHDLLVFSGSQKDLFSAMESCNSNLTQEEKRLNSHGPMLIYSYSEKSLGEFIHNFKQLFCLKDETIF